MSNHLDKIKQASAIADGETWVEELTEDEVREAVEEKKRSLKALDKRIANVSATLATLQAKKAELEAIKEPVLPAKVEA